LSCTSRQMPYSRRQILSRDDVTDRVIVYLLRSEARALHASCAPHLVPRTSLLITDNPQMPNESTAKVLHSNCQGRFSACLVPTRSKHYGAVQHVESHVEFETSWPNGRLYRHKHENMTRSFCWAPSRQLQCNWGYSACTYQNQDSGRYSGPFSTPSLKPAILVVTLHKHRACLRVSPRGACKLPEHAHGQTVGPRAVSTGPRPSQCCKYICDV
jgi:hypothetical protein